MIASYTSPNPICYHFTDSDGIDGGTKNAIIEAIKQDDYNLYINLKSWNSKANTDEKTHTFDKSTATQLLISNINYPYLTNIKIRTEYSKDQIITLEAGQSITLEYTGSFFTYKGNKLQQIDFNSGNKSDDLNFSWSDVSGEVTYKASYSSETNTIIDTKKGYIYGTVDADGIDGNRPNTQLDAYFSGGKMHIDIRE